MACCMKKIILQKRDSCLGVFFFEDYSSYMEEKRIISRRSSFY